MKQKVKIPLEEHSSLADKIFRICFTNNFVLFVIISLPIILITAYNYTYLNDHLRKHSFSNFQRISVASTAALDEKLNNLTRLGLNFTTNPKFRKDVAEGKWDEAALITDVYKNISDEQFIDLIFLTDAQGNIKSASPQSPDIIGKNYSYRDWYYGATSTGQPYVSEVYRRANIPERNIIAVATPIIGEDQLITGVLVFQVRLEHFAEWINKISVGPKGYVYIVDQKGQIVASPEVASQGNIVNLSSKPEVRDVVTGHSGVMEVYDSEKKSNVLVSYQPSQYHWGVFVQQSASEAFAERRFVQLALFSILIIVLFINGVFVLLLKKALQESPTKYKPLK